MKRIITILTILAVCGIMHAQGVFTVVYATSDDGFVNVRATPSGKARILGKLWMFSHGLGSGVKRGTSGNWTKVSVGKVTGWCYSKYVGTQTWYKGDGSPRLVATRENTPIYTDNYDDGVSLPVFTTVKKGTIIADEFTEDDKYYILVTAHDYLYIRKRDAKVVR